MICVLVINYFCQVLSNPHGMISLFDICRCFIFVTGMREGEDEEMDVCPAPRALLEIGQGPTHRVPRVKSAHTPQEMVDAMDSIRELQHSLNHRPKSTLTSAAG